MRFLKPLHVALLLLALFSLPSWADGLGLEVYKNPQCGCCGKWVDHMNAAGFDSTAINRDDLSGFKAEHGIARQYQSCHTGLSGGYVFEGHVPAAEVKRFLASPPEGAIGLAVPGMPVGSPGMEMGDRHQDYDVLLLKEDGSAEVFAKIRPSN